MSTARRELEELLTAEELAAILKKSVEAIQKDCQRGLIPHLRLGRLLRFRPSAIEAWLAEKGRESSTNRG